jgi:FAD/FMN-containing dehydrogenase
MKALFPTSVREWIEAQQFVSSLGLDERARALVCNDRLLLIQNLDLESMTVDVGSGVLLSALEKFLNEHDLSLGPLSPEAFQLKLGDFLEGPLAGLRSVPMGRVEPISARLLVVTHEGYSFETSRAPRSAAGPDLNALFLASHGAYGRIIEATVRVFPKPQSRDVMRFTADDRVVALSQLRRAISLGAYLARIDFVPQVKGVDFDVVVQGSSAQVAREARMLSRLLTARAETHNTGPLGETIGPEREVGWAEMADPQRWSGHRIGLGKILMSRANPSPEHKR